MCVGAHVGLFADLELSKCERHRDKLRERERQWERKRFRE